jgi:pyruvate kinase
MLSAGVDVVRVNSAHGTGESRSQLMELVRHLRGRLNRHVAVHVDLQGPRIRVGALDQARELPVGAEVVLAPEALASGEELPTTYEALARDVKPGSRILLDDGLLVLETTAVDGPLVRAVVRHGGFIKSNKGMNLPDDHISAPALTEKDRREIELALAHEVDFIGVSFVSRAEDVEEVRSLVGASARVVSKVERPAALEDLKRILQVSDALMVARGDLGVELPFEEVPLTQKHLIAQAIGHGTPVITATQMLESMINNPRPTRAEASDVANAILDGTDAVMLSGETAVGSYPVAAVRAMVRIIQEIEQAVVRDRVPRRRRRDFTGYEPPGQVEDAVASAAAAAAEMLEVPLILCVTQSGFTARKIAASRPSSPIVGLSTAWKTCRYLSLVWGVTPLHSNEVPNYETMLGVAREALLERGYASIGDRIVVTAGVPFEVPGTTNLIKVETV